MRSDRARVQDVLDAITEINRFLPASRSAFDSDPPIQSHIYRHLLIVGEAAWRLSKSLKELHPNVPWKLIEGMRHIMVHDYFKVDLEIVYTTAHKDIPTLREQFEAILMTLPR